MTIPHSFFLSYERMTPHPLLIVIIIIICRAGILVSPLLFSPLAVGVKLEIRGGDGAFLSLSSSRHLAISISSTFIYFFFSPLFLSRRPLLGFVLGDPQRLVNPTDSQGKLCGHDAQVKDRPFLLFFDLTRCNNPSVLTHGCPTPQVHFFSFLVSRSVCLFTFSAVNTLLVNRAVCEEFPISSF